MSKIRVCWLSSCVYSGLAETTYTGQHWQLIPALWLNSKLVWAEAMDFSWFMKSLVWGSTHFIMDSYEKTAFYHTRASRFTLWLGTILSKNQTAIKCLVQHNGRNGLSKNTIFMTIWHGWCTGVIRVVKLSILKCSKLTRYLSMAHLASMRERPSRKKNMIRESNNWQ